MNNCINCKYGRCKEMFVEMECVLKNHYPMNQNGFIFYGKKNLGKNGGEVDCDDFTPRKPKNQSKNKKN